MKHWQYTVIIGFLSVNLLVSSLLLAMQNKHTKQLEDDTAYLANTVSALSSRIDSAETTLNSIESQVSDINVTVAGLE